MEATRIIYDDYERTASGMVYVGKSRERTNLEKINRVKIFLLRLIEEEFELSFRSQNCLNNSGIKLVGQLVQKSASELLNLKNFGRTSLRDIEEDLKEKGLTLDMALNFFPWNGNDNGAELIRMLSLQKPGGGFLMDKKTAKEIGLDLKGANHTAGKKKQSVLHTKYLLDWLKSNFEKDIAYLTDLLKPHRIWLERNEITS
ncbi:MAG: hypothetical protein JW976_00870 [Syntrophaceae bacterium]|nr:hypothetical protein [Syntrophaceae bacterium]